MSHIGHLFSIGKDVGAKFTEWQEQVGMYEPGIACGAIQNTIFTHMHFSHAWICRTCDASPIRRSEMDRCQWQVFHYQVNAKHM